MVTAALVKELREKTGAEDAGTAQKSLCRKSCAQWF